MGVGRFVYTPILPLMQQQTDVTHSASAVVATMNYVGYFIGAVAMGVKPGWARSRTVFRTAIVVLVLSELAMLLAPNAELWATSRLIAGIASAAVFVYCTTSIVGHRSPGIAFAGVGVGIACSGALVVLLESRLTWGRLWIVAAALTAAYGAGAWGLASGSSSQPTRRVPNYSGRLSKSAIFLCGSYFLEGVGYIILGTFLVAEVSSGAAQWTGPVAWIVVGLAAGPSPALWAIARQHAKPEMLLTGALVLQSISALIPAFLPGTLAATCAAILFGGTFMGITLLAMVAGSELGIPRSAAILTALYGLGQIVGPLLVAPLLSAGYRPAFICSGIVLALAAACAALVRVRKPVLETCREV